MGKRVILILLALVVFSGVCGADSTEIQPALSGSGTVQGFSPMANGGQTATFPEFQDTGLRHDSTVLFYNGSTLFSWFEDIEVVGNYAYCAAYYGLVVLDVSDPNNPHLISELYIDQGDGSVCHMMNGAPDRYITVAGNYAYMTLACAGLRIIDISNPASPLLVGICVDVPYPFHSNYSWADVIVHGSYAYIGTGPHVGAGLLTVNISDPANPLLEGYISFNWGQAAQLAVKDHYIYIAGLNNITIIDISNPGAPVLKGTLPQYADAIAISGNYAYVAGGGLFVFDLTQPESLTVIDSVTTTHCVTSIKINDHYAYLAGNNSCQFYYFAGGRITIIDIANPNDVVPVTTQAPDIGVRNVAAAGSHAFVAGIDGMKVLDISNPANPSETGAYIPGRSFAVEVAGNFAYVRTSRGLKVVDITDPASPTPFGFCPLSSDAVVSLGKSLVVADEYVYSCNADSSIEVVDARNPAVPVSVGHIDLDGSPQGIALDGNYLYVAASEAGLVAIDIANPATPEVVGSYNTSGNAGSVVVQGDYAYVADGENHGLVIIDVSNHSAPDSVGGYIGVDSPGCYDVAVYDHHAYAADQVLDISDPTNPILLVGSFACGNLITSGGYLFVMGGIGSYGFCGSYADFCVYRLTETLSLYERECRIGPGFPLDIAMQGNYVYMVDATGLQVIHMPGVNAEPGLFSDGFTTGPDAAWNQIEGSCTWTATGTTWRTSATGQQVYCTQTVGDTSWHNYEYEVEVNGHSGVDKVINFRLQDANHWYGLNLRSSTGELLLTKRTGGGMPDVLATAPYLNATNTWYWLRVRCIDETFHVYINDSEVLTYADTSEVYYSGGIGITCYTGAYGSCDIEFDNVSVTELPDHAPGDANGDSTINIGDAVFLVNYIFREGQTPESEQVSDANCDRKINIGDAVYLVNYIFRGGPAPGCP